VTTGLQLGAPGVYPAPAPVDRSFRPVRLDVAGFVGVAPRGPVDEPVLVRRWSDYLVRFGGFSQPGLLLPYAVSAFFEQGGERAWVVRVAPREGAADATARHRLLGLAVTAAPVQFAAHDEGDWGNPLRLRLEFEVRQQFFTTTMDPPGGGGQEPAAELELPDGVDIPLGSLLRVRGPGLPAVGELRWVEELGLREVSPGRLRGVVVLDRPLDAGRRWGIAVVTAALQVDDPDPDLPRSERIIDLGLHERHPRFLAYRVAEESLLVTPVGDWVTQRVPPAGPLLPAAGSERVHDGRDRYQEIDGASFFDGPPGDPPDPDPLGERPHHGADRLAREEEVGLLAVPDLFWSGLAEVEVEFADIQEPGGASFGPCPDPPVATTFRRPARLALLDPRAPDDLAEILARQRHLVELAERYRRFVVLLDVPQQLAVRAIAQWRAGFDSSYAAAYHPWLSVTRTVLGPSGAASNRSQVVPPSAFAAGIIAARERRLGLSFGPANELAQGAVLAVDQVSDADHNVLHQLGVNVYQAERDGFRLTAARTLSRDRDLRQLSVRRLMTMLRLVLERQAQWVVFEPNTAVVREVLRNGIVLLLSELYRGGAFAGASEEESFFVRSDDSLNPRASLELGRLVVEVGVAPAEPLEFLVLRISRDGDGGVRVEADDRGR
jgi:hypothetical protein